MLSDRRRNYNREWIKKRDNVTNLMVVGSVKKPFKTIKTLSFSESRVIFKKHCCPALLGLCVLRLRQPSVCSERWTGDGISQHMTRSDLHTTNIYGAGYTQWRRMGRGVLAPHAPTKTHKTHTHT